MDLFIATGNTHKVEELQTLLSVHLPDVRVHSALALGGMPPVVEDADTFKGNSLLKARALWGMSGGQAVLADDSGLCVDALAGAPGIFSARYAGDNATDGENRAKLLESLANVPVGGRAAHFSCVLAFIDANGKEHTFSGECPGEITLAEEGSGGFGYDPVFRPEGFEETFGTLSPETKNRLSHRAIALADFVRFLVGN
jgi:non-canonical purine NTP pyrophosphatase (RdgB/HAM1 family)